MDATLTDLHESRIPRARLRRHAQKALHGLLLAAVLGLAACSTENLPIVGRPAASYDNGSVKMADYKLRLKVLQENYRKQKQAQGEVKFPSLDGPAGRNNEVILE